MYFIAITADKKLYLEVFASGEAHQDVLYVAVTLHMFMLIIFSLVAVQYYS